MRTTRFLQCFNIVYFREILSEQHRLMYYTVTVSTLSPHHLTRVRKDSRNLKWQFASTLYKSQVCQHWHCNEITAISANFSV